jgi:hypothetical protein
VNGAGTLSGREIKTGQTVLLPATLPDIEVAGKQSNLILLVSAPTAAAC